MAIKKKKRQGLTPEERLFIRHLRTWYTDHPEYEANRAAFIRKRLLIDVPILRRLWEKQGGKSAIGGRAISLNSGVSNAYDVLATPRHIPVRASIDHKKPRHLYRNGQLPLEEIYDLEKNGQWVSTFQNHHKNGYRQEDLERQEAENRKYHELMAQVSEGAGEYQQHSRHFLSKKALRIKLAATLAASGNTEEGLSFEQALNQMRSANQKAFKDIIGKASSAIGVKPHLEDAIGDWTDGAEHSVLQRVHEPIDERTSEYLAAWYGLLANQKSVLVFHPKHQGPDSTYEIDLPETDLAKVRDSLNQAGIPFRTIVPTRKGTKVVIYDEGRQLRNNVAQFGEAHNADIRESTGQGRYIGGSTRTHARSKYRRIITAYEARSGHSAAGRYAQTQTGPIPASIPTIRSHHSGAGQVPQAPAPQVPQQEPARMSKGLMGKFRDKWETIKENLRKSSPVECRKRKWAERDRRALELQGKVKESRVQAPVGGMIVRGIFYPGGRMIPTKNYEEEQKARYARGDVAGALKAEADRKARVKYAADESPSANPFTRLRSQIAKTDGQIQEGQGNRASGISQDIATSRTNPYQAPQRTDQLVGDVTDAVRNGSPAGTVQQTPQERAAVTQRIQQRPWEDPYRPNAGSNSARAWGDVNARLRQGIAEQNSRLAEQNVNRRLNDREEALQRGPNVRSAAARAVGRTVPPSGQAPPASGAERVNPNYIPPKGASPGFNPNTGTGQSSLVGSRRNTDKAQRWNDTYKTLEDEMVRNHPASSPLSSFGIQGGGSVRSAFTGKAPHGIQEMARLKTNIRLGHDQYGNPINQKAAGNFYNRLQSKFSQETPGLFESAKSRMDRMKQEVTGELGTDELGNPTHP